MSVTDHAPTLGRYPDLLEPVPVLDKGFVQLKDWLGSDSSIVQSARVSYQAGTKTVRDDAQLLDYLIRKNHSSPLEQAVMQFHLKMPIFVARQLTRHRTARLNEISGRYSVMTDDCYVPDPERIQKQSAANKQGSGDAFELPEQRELAAEFTGEQTEVYHAYRERVDRGMARELARINLPLSLYTEMVWQIDLHNLFHFLRLRLDGHAQYEVRVYAQAMATVAAKLYPLAYAAFEEHILNAVTFSASEGRALKRLLEVASGEELEDDVKLVSAEWRKSLQDEFMQKIVALG